VFTVRSFGAFPEPDEMASSLLIRDPMRLLKVSCATVQHFGFVGAFLVHYQTGKRDEGVIASEVSYAAVT
jgi:hypothetical protein